MSEDNEVILPDESENDSWLEYFPDEIEKEMWKTNFKDVGPEVATQYKTILPDLEPHIAANFYKNGLDAYNVKDWYEYGITNKDNILDWHQKTNGNPEIASKFLDKGITAETYSQWNSKFGINNVDEMLYFYEDLKLSADEMEKYVKPLVDEGKLELYDIQMWVGNEIPISEIKDWVDVGLIDPYEIRVWKELKLDPKETSKWRELTNVEMAAKWIINGYNYKDAKSFIEMGYYDPEQLDQALDNLEVKMG